MNNDQIDFEVGYGKPPVAARFKKGRSGNPGGRPKKTTLKLKPGKFLQLIDNEEIVVNIGGKGKRMLKAEIVFRQQFTAAIKGNLRDAWLIAKMAAEYFKPEADGPSMIQFRIVPDNLDKPIDAKKTLPRKTRPQASLGSQFRKIANQQIGIEIEGSKHKISRWEAYLRQVYNMVLNRDSGAARLLHQLRRQFPGDLLPGDTITYLITEEDAKL
jgi:Family of unknown function (DUF5681)